MDSISFQNGFVCGMASKGLVKSGAIYEPVAYNDAGVYDFFYLDFKRVMEPFSIGQFNESVIVSGTGILTVSQVTQATNESGNKLSGVYKVYCDLSAQTHGIVIVNKAKSRLCFSSGEQTPSFSIPMYVSGLPSYIDGGYLYDCAELWTFEGSVTENESFALADSADMDSISESCSFNPSILNAAITETPTITLT